MKMYRYKKSTGEIDAYCDRSVSINPIPPDTEELGYIATEEFDWNVYVDITTNPPSLIQKTELNVSWDKTTIEDDGIDTATLSGVPVGCKFLVNGEEIVIDDGTLEVSSDAVGTIHVLVLSHQYKKQSWSIEVV
jgi:hypothetical protein